jgi:hypothetical protein
MNSIFNVSTLCGTGSSARVLAQQSSVFLPALAYSTLGGSGYVDGACSVAQLFSKCLWNNSPFGFVTIFRVNFLVV